MKDDIKTKMFMLFPWSLYLHNSEDFSWLQDSDFLRFLYRPSWNPWQDQEDEDLMVIYMYTVKTTWFFFPKKSLKYQKNWTMPSDDTDISDFCYVFLEYIHYNVLYYIIVYSVLLLKHKLP